MKFFDKMPPEITVEMFTYLLKYEHLVVVIAVSKNFNRLVNHFYTQADQELMQIVSLPTKLRCLVLSGHYTLDFAKDIKRILDLPIEERLSVLLTAEQLANLHVSMKNSLGTDYSIMALREQLITIDQIQQFRIQGIHPAEINSRLRYLFYDKGYNGIRALREGHITLEQIIAMPEPFFSMGLYLSNQGFQALREGLITVDQAEAMPTHMGRLFSKKGLQALRRKRISLKEAANYSADELKMQLLELTEHAPAQQSSILS